MTTNSVVLGRFLIFVKATGSLSALLDTASTINGIVIASHIMCTVCALFVRNFRPKIEIARTPRLVNPT
jgi:hypothetical protein